MRKNLNSIDDTADKTYVATTAASGATPAVQVVTGIVNVAGTSNGRGTANTGIYSVDLRGKTNVLGDDLFDVNAIAYGYLQQTQRVALKGVGTLVTAFALVADASVGSITESQAGALTTIWTLDQLYAAAKYWKTRAVLAQLEYPTSTTLPVTASGTVLNLGALNLVIDANASAAFALNTATATITIKASALAAGTLFQTFSTTGSMTLANGAAAQVIYTSAAGKNAVLQLTGVPSGAFVYVATNGGAPFAFTAGGGTYTAYLPVGATGTWSWKVALYGSLAASGTFTPAGNTSSAAIALAADPGITQATAATVAAYTALSSPDQLYDYAAYYETTAAGIASARKVAKTGTSADLGAQSLTIDANASSLFAVSGTALTIKAATFAAGSTMSALTTTGAVTPANGAAITCVYTSSAGTAGILNLTGLQAGSAVYVTKADGTQAAYTAATAGTTYTLYIPPGAAATWTWKAAKYGYLEASAAFASTGAQSAAVTQLVDPGITQASAATVAAYTTIANLDALYDYSAYWATTNAGIAVPRVVAKAGSTADLGTRALTLDATASVVWSVTSGAVTINAGTLAAGVTFLTLSAPAAALGLAHGAAIAAVYTDSAGRHVTVTAAGLIAGTRVQLWNSTDAVEVDNSVVGGSGGYVFPLIYTADKVYRLRATYASGATAMLPLQSSGTFGASGLAFAVSQAADAVYNANAVDGSTATEFAADFPHIQVDVSSSGGTTTVQRLYAWLVYEQTQADGIRNFYGCVAASDTANYVIDQSVVALQLDNVLSTPVRVTGGYLTRKDASTIIAPSSGSIQMDPGKAYVAAGGSTPGAITVPAGARVILMGSTGKYLAKGS